MKTKSLGWLLFLLMLPIIPLFVQAQKTSHIADKFDPVQSGTVPVNEATNPDVLRAQQALQVQSGGRGVAQDFAEAVKWYRKAADQNFAAAQYELGVCYMAGKGVPRDDKAEAAKWYRKAAEQNDADAQFNLGVFYDNGQGVPQDYSQALEWFRKAADQGDADAQNSLGLMYAKGQGVPQDYVEAYKWYNLAAAQGETYAVTNRDSITGSMTPDQIAEGQRLAAAFVRRDETSGSSSDNSASPDNPTASGTGFFITEDGYLVSNYHVVKDATKVRLLTSAGLIDAKVVQVDAANDLALLKANAEGRMKNEEIFKPLPIAASRTVVLGGTVATVGFPDIGLQGFAPKLAKGEIASLSGAGDDPRYFQISVPVQPGNSGGALVDERGNVIGIVSAKLDASVALAASGALPENVNYAVKSSLLLSFLESVPDVDAKLKKPNTADEKFEDVVKSAQQAAVLVLVY
ncbi:MAG: tetratricopeptide repeat-containing serine protease family protein [Verrucomicrobiia bacterium]